MKKILGIIISLSACYVEPVPGPGPSPSGLGYYECDTFVQCGNGQYTSTLYTGCAYSASAAADSTVDQCLSDYYYACGGSVYCSTSCYGGSLACRSSDEELTQLEDMSDTLSR